MGVTVGVSVGVTVGVRMTTISMVVVIKWILKHLGRRTKAYINAIASHSQ